jgi:decaprenylphospho-beta-D-ribofuranose 2-oxidase
LSGWGRTAPSRAYVVRPRDREELASAVCAGAGRRGGLIPRGAGRSYGDAAQNGGGFVLETIALRFIEAVDPESHTVRVGAGTTLAELMIHLTAQGLTLPVTPGTSHVTVGGAIAADVHGKNHHREGSFGHHVESLVLCTPGGETLKLSRLEHGQLFEATVGGMGLTGVIVEATLHLQRLPSTELWADIDRTDDLEGALSLMAEDDPKHRYAIAWVDLLGGPAIGRRRGPGLRGGATGGLGRSVVVRSDYAPSSTTPSPLGAPSDASHRVASPLAGEGRSRPGASAPALARRESAVYGRRPRAAVPTWFPAAFLNPLTVQVYNRLRWRTTPRRARERPLGMNAHFFPLDAVGDWNRLYGQRGLVQYQFAVPAGEERSLLAAVEGLRAARLPMYLVVLKRLGPGSGGPISFPLAGWTLAIDIPAGASGLHRALEDADGLVAGAGGRVYLAKDARLRGETLAAMYPGLGRFQALRAQVDPRGVLRSDMARRLGLC